MLKLSSTRNFFFFFFFFFTIARKMDGGAFPAFPFFFFCATAALVFTLNLEPVFLLQTGGFFLVGWDVCVASVVDDFCILPAVLRTFFVRRGQCRCFFFSFSGVLVAFFVSDLRESTIDSF